MFRLCDLAHATGQCFTYLYDFGDSWQHEITQEQTCLDASRLPCFFYCIDGEGSCLPEDCGVIEGYYRLFSVLGNPGHEEYGETTEWLEGMAAFSCSPPFSPEFIDLNVINYRLGFYWRWSRLRYLPLSV